jgi:hypothetical protein
MRIKVIVLNKLIDNQSMLQHSSSLMSQYNNLKCYQTFKYRSKSSSYPNGTSNSNPRSLTTLVYVKVG